MSAKKTVSKRSKRREPSARVQRAAAFIEQFKQQVLQAPHTLEIGSSTTPLSAEERADLARLVKLNQRKAHRRKIPKPPRGQETRDAIADEHNRQILGEEAFYYKHIPGFDPHSPKAQVQIDAFEDKVRKMKRRDELTAEKQKLKAEQSYPVFRVTWRRPPQPPRMLTFQQAATLHHMAKWVAANWSTWKSTSPCPVCGTTARTSN